MAEQTPGDTPRYGAGANIENHPQITDYVPRKFRSMAKLLLPGLLLLGLAEYFAANVNSPSSLLAGIEQSAIDALADRIAAWTTAVALVISAAYAHIIYLLKRHRIDDIKGRYRAWRTGLVLALVFSFDAITGLHDVIGRILGTLTGFHPLADAAWWLIPYLVVGGVVLSRIILNAAECRASLLTFGVSCICLAIAAALFVGGGHGIFAGLEPMISRSFPALGAITALLGCMLTARYVVLDVQGLIEHSEEGSITSHSSPNSGAGQVDTTTHLSHEFAEETKTEWTDGSEPDVDYPDDDDRLSKAERKKLRKQHRRSAA